MAKSNKGRKLFATSATAALVASAIVPVASAAAQVNDFNSVSPYAQEAVQDLVDRGVITGDAKGNFNPKNNVTRAEGATIFTKAFELEATGTINFSDVKAGAWYYDAIAAAVSNGIFQGQGAGKFNPTGNLTRSEAAIIYVAAFGLEGTADLSEFKDGASVKAWAKEAIEIAVANGVLKGDNGSLKPNDPITKQDFAVMFSRAEDAAVNPAADLKDATEALKEAVGKLADKVTAENAAAAKTAVADTKAAIEATEKALAAAKEAGVVTEEEIKAIEEGIAAAKTKLEAAEKLVAAYETSLTNASKVESVSATNLKQVVVAFDGKVDPSTAGEAGNYSLTGANSPAVHSVIVAQDGLSVTLNIVDKLDNQAEYKLAVNNVKSGDKVINEKDLKFKPLDNTVPTVSKVEALGNKTIRVHFSEPVKPAQTSQFKIDGKVVVGSIQTNLNTVIIKLSSALTDGEHTLTSEGTEDYNNFKTVQADTKFNVVEDKTAPTVSVVSASFEKVVLKFSEPVEQVFASNIYWMQGGAKKQASSVKQLTDDTFELTFVGDNKLVYTTDLFVTNVKDYSGNVIDKDTKVQVTPVIDQTRPEVISTTFVKDSNNKKLTIKFTKSLDETTAKKAANYVIKDKDGKVQPISSTVDVSKDKEVTITLLGSLKDNSDYTLSVTGVSDNTTLKNVMLPYTTTLSVKDVTPPELKQVTRLNDKQLYVAFSEAMATSGDGSIVETEKYTVTKPDGKTLTIASFNVTQDSKGVILTFNDTLPAEGSNFTVKVQLVKDLAGNYLKDLSKTLSVAAQSETKIESVEAIAKDKVEVEFSNPIQSLVQGDFTITGSDIAHSEISTDGKTVTFTLKSDLAEDAKKDGSSVTLTVKTAPSTVDVLGKNIKASEVVAVTDRIKATVDTVSTVANRDDQIKITFNEAVKLSANSNETDFLVTDGLNASNKVKVTKVELDPSNATTSKIVILTLDKNIVAATVEVANPRFVTDANGNVIAKIEPTSVELDKAGADAVIAAAKSALTTAITAAQTAHNSVSAEGVAVGDTVVGSKVILQAAIDAATLVKNNSSATATQLNAAKNTLDTAVATFTTSKVVALTGLNDVTLALVNDNDLSNDITLAAGETLGVSSSDATKVTAVVDTLTKVKVTHVASGSAVITVQVKNATGKVVKTGTFTVTAS